ncbi:MAG: TonB-dependent receptor domain-containing protein [Acidobacteriota bacterium]
MCGSESTFFLTAKKYLLGLAFLLAAVPLAAQTGVGVVRGTVTDASGAVVMKAKVVLTNTATGVTDAVETAQSGAYYFGAVRPGPYTLTVEVPGFKKWSGTLQLEVGQTATIDPALEVGSVESTIEVTGAAPVIATEGAQVSDVKDALRIHELPLNGRVVTNLFNLTAGVEGGGNPRVNGMKVGSAEMLLDGVSLVNRFGGGMSQVQPGLDTIQEYRVETAGSSAQYSRPATVSLVTKSGTNEIHGNLFWTHRNNFGGLRARQRQDDASTPPQYIRNEYGGSAGGPIIKNKTFWFFSYEGQKERQARFAQAQVPTEAIWNGNFSGATNTNSDPITIYDPLTTRPDGTRDPFPGNIIPQDRIAPIAATMKTVSALPTDLAANPWTSPNFTAYYPRTYDLSTYTGKIDQVFSEKDNVSGRFTFSKAPTKLFGGRYGYPPPGSTDAGGTGRQDTNLYSIYGRWNHVFTPTFLNEFQASANRTNNSSGTLADDVAWADKLGFPNPFGVTGWPTICAESSFFYYGCWDGDNRGDQHLTAFQIEDNVTWVKGKHNVRFGFKGRKEYSNVRELQQAQGSHSFGGDWTGLFNPADDQRASFTGDGFASMLLGLPTYLSNQYNRGYFYFRQSEFGPYFQDTWRVTQRLTLDLGVRWDKWTVYKEKYDRLVNLDIAQSAAGMQVITPHNTKLESIQGIPPSVLESWAGRGMTWKTANEVGFPSGLLPADNNNFAPRIGVAFRLTDRTVLRGGYGIYYWTMPLSQILQSSRINPPLNLRFQNDLSSQNSTNFNYATKSAPGPNDHIGTATVDITGNKADTLTGAQGFMPWDIHNWADNQAQEWTFTIERELMKETALRLSYIGNHGSNLEQRWRWNDPESEWNYQARTGQARPSNTDLRRVNPNWQSGCCNAPVSHNGYSNTHSLQAEVERRYSNGLAFQGFYTYAHAMTTSDTGGFNFGSSGINSSGSGTAFAVPENILIMGEPNLTPSQRLRLGYANSVEVPAHRVRWNGVYDLPFGKGKKFGRDVSGALNVLIGGWQIGFIGEWRSGYWTGVASNRYLFGDPTLTADERITMNIFDREQRLWFRGYFDPTQASGVDSAKLLALVPADPAQRILRPLGPEFDNRIPQTLADGSVRMTDVSDMVNWNARNFFRGPGAWNQDISVFKTIPIRESLRVRFTADFFNALNHPVDVAPNAETGLQDLSIQANDPRIIQFSARVEW